GLRERGRLRAARVRPHDGGPRARGHPQARAVEVGLLQDRDRGRRADPARRLRLLAPRRLLRAALSPDRRLREGPAGAAVALPPGDGPQARELRVGRSFRAAKRRAGSLGPRGALPPATLTHARLPAGCRESHAASPAPPILASATAGPGASWPRAR